MTQLQLNINILKLLMIFQQSEDSLNAWKTQMHLYEKGKRTKKPFGKTTSQISHVTHEKIKADECRFNPILQSYAHPQEEAKSNQLAEDRRAKSLMNHLKQTVKYEKNFDIVNLHSNEPYKPKSPTRKLGPIRNAFNVINNQKMPDYYFENRQMRLPLERSKKLLEHHNRDFNIVTGTFKNNHQQKVQEQIDKQTNQIYQKYAQTHNYDPVFGKFYDAEKQEAYQKERMIKQKEHGKEEDLKLPPSYVHREPLILDYTKPLPETLKMLDQRNNNAKKRFQTKYVVLDEYDKRNFEEEAKQEKILKNHVHFGRVLDEKCKEFNIINNFPYRETRAEQLYGKKLEVESWDKLLRDATKVPPPKKPIKTAGFS